MRKNTIMKALHEEEYLDRLAPFANFLSKFSEEGLTQTIYEILDDMAENGRFDIGVAVLEAGYLSLEVNVTSCEIR